MAVFRDTYDLLQDDAVVAQVIAINEIGESVPSDPNTGGALVMTAPQKPAIPVRDDDSTTDIALAVDFAYDDTSAANGGSSVTSAALYWDSGTNEVEWTELIGETADSLASSFTVNTGIQRSSFYHFKTRTKNIFGWSEYSDVLEVKAATRPQVMTSVTTTIFNPLRISWVAPDDMGDTITAYIIEVEAHDGSYVEDTTNCAGSDQTIID
jgi:hypothetical protein